LVERQKSRETPPRHIRFEVEEVQDPTSGKFVPKQSVQGAYADSYVNAIGASPGKNVGITIPAGKSFWMTDLTITNTGTASDTVTVTDGSAGTVKETVALGAGATVKLAYSTPKKFATSVFAYGAVGTVNVSTSGILA
jgi:hypothetical protein